MGELHVEDETIEIEDRATEVPVAAHIPTTEEVIALFEKSHEATPRGAVFKPREVIPGQSVNDAGDSDGPPYVLDAPAPPSESGALALGGEVRPMVGIDASQVKTGFTVEGVLAAVRAVAYEQQGDRRLIHIYRPGLCYIGNANAVEIMHKIGCAFDDPEHYVRLKDGVPIAEKGLTHSHQQRADRVRNFVERTVQFYATTLIRNGLIVLDGAATTDTYDTPPEVMERLADAATAGGNHLVALSKKTRLLVSGRELRHALEGFPDGPFYRYLNPLLRDERIKAAELGLPRPRRSPLGHLYAARFSFAGETYRVDVVPAPGYGPDEALASFFASTLFRAGYPEILIRPHLHAFISYPDLIGLQAAAVAHFGFSLRRELNLTPAFAPFGGRWK
jgi:hypothetical protein